MSITWAIERSSWIARSARRRLMRVSIVIRKNTATATYTTSPIALSMPCASSGSVGGPIWTCSDLRLTSRPTSIRMPRKPIATRSGISGRLIQIAVSAVWCAMPSSSRTTPARPEPGKRCSTRCTRRSTVRSIRSGLRAR